MIKEEVNNRIIPDTVRQWILEGKCTPLNPAWLFVNKIELNAVMWKGEERQHPQQRRFLEQQLPNL